MISILELVASSRGGAAVHVRELTELLDPDLFAVTVAMPEDGGNVAAVDFTDHNVSFHRLDMAGAPSLTASLSLRGLLQERRFDILHCHWARAALHGRLAAALLRSGRPRTVYTIHGFAAPHYGFPKGAVLLGIERILAPVTDAFIAVSEAERKDFLAAGFAPPARVHVVLNGIDTARFVDVAVDRAGQRAALGVPTDALLVTTVCRLYRPRDFDTLLSGFAMARAHSPNVHLLIVGDGPYRPEIETLVSKLGLGGNVTLVGFRRDIPEILAVSDIFVLSTALWEALGLAILEAMASQVPVVASDVGGIKEVVTHQETGIVVPPKDRGALAEALLDLLGNERKARMMGQKGRERVEDLFTLDRMARETMEIYEALVNRV